MSNYVCDRTITGDCPNAQTDLSIEEICESMLSPFSKRYTKCSGIVLQHRSKEDIQEEFGISN